MAFTLNRRLAQLVDSNGQLNTGKIPNDYITSDHVADNTITAAMLHTSFTVSTSNLTAIDTDDVSEGTSNLYFTNARADARIAAATTDDLTEGSTNLYFTNARIDSHLSGGTGVTYSSGAISIGQDVGTTATPTFGNITTTGYIAGPATFTIDPAAVGDNTGTVVIAGNLQVDGTTTTINSTTVNVDDLNIQLATGAANAAAADGAGITVDGASATITYDGTTDKWDFNKFIEIGSGYGGTPNIESQLVLNDSGNNYITIGSGASSEGGILFADSGDNDVGVISYNHSTNSLGFRTNGVSNRIIIDSSGNVGIGTDSPDSILHIEGSGVDSLRFGNIGPSNNSALRISRDDDSITTGNPLGYLEFGGKDNTGNVDTAHAYVGAIAEAPHSAGDNATALIFGTTADNSSSILERMRIDADGNVGIGTDDIGTNSKLDVFGGAVQIINNAASFEGSTADASLHIKGQEPTQNRLTQMSSFGTSKRALNLIASTDSGGNDQWWSWGVDDDDEFKILHATDFNDSRNGLRISNTGALYQNSTSASPLVLALSSANSNCDITLTSVNATSSPGARLRSGTDDFQIFTNGSERLRIASDGKVGIFANINASDPDSEFELLQGINYNADSGISSRIGINSTAVDNTKVYAWRDRLTGSASAGHDKVTETLGRTESSWTERFRIGANGRVGIGEASTGANLHVIGEGSSNNLNDFGMFDIEDTSDNGIAFGYNTTSGMGFIYARTRGTDGRDLILNNSLRIKRASDGSVGIGANPSARFHVRKDGAGFQTAARFENTNTNSHNLYINVDDDNNLVQLQSTGSDTGGFKFTAGNTDIVHFNSNGKVIVSPLQSTTNSLQFLNVVQNGEAGIGIESPNGTSPRTWELIVGGSGGAFAGGKFGLYNRTAGSAAITVDGNNNAVFGGTIDVDSINIDGQANGGSVLTFENNSWIAIKDASGSHRRSMGTSGDTLYIGDVDNQFDATYLIGQQRPDTAMTVTSYGGGAGSYTNSMMLTGNNNQNLWLLVDGANSAWGLYHRNIDTAETYSTDEPLRSNSIAWVGQGRLSGYFTLENKNAGATIQASYVRGGVAGVYHDFKFKSDSGFEIGKGDDGEPVHTPTINERSSASTGVNATVGNGSPGVYWLHFNGKRFRAYIRPNWLQGRNWVLAAKWFSHTDMPSGSDYWTNDTYHNEGDFNLLSGLWSKYLSWRYFSFDRLAMQMGDRIAPIMQFSSSQTLYGAFSGGRANNGGGVTASSTDPQIGNNATYHGMTNYMGPNFTDLGGSEDIMQSYGLNKWANNSLNGTSANNNGSADLNSNTSKGFQLTVEDSHRHIAGQDSVGRAGAWIGCPLDEGGYTFGGASSNSGADSGFGFGGGTGNTARTWTSGVAEWARGNEVANYHPAYVWLSID